MSSRSLLVLVLLSGLAQIASARGDGFDTHRDVSYVSIEGVDPRLLSLDLYAPLSEGKHPVVVMIHGGGWRRGDKGGRGMTRDKVPHFVGRGYVYVSINYRLSPAVKHPTHVRDVARALAFLHDNVVRYRGDPDRMFVMGHSAGAHLAALVATDRRPLGMFGKKLSILRGVICLDTAAYDVPRYVNELGAGPRMRAMYETAFGTGEAAWRDASPRHHVAPGKGIPPMLFFHTGRRMAGEKLSGEIVAALRAAGTPAAAVHAADKDHAGINRCIGQEGDPYTALIMRFLERPDSANELAHRPGTARTTLPVTFTTEYEAGATDPNGAFMGGTETMRLVAHDGKLFAAVGYWTDQSGGDPRPGGQVLVKTGPNRPWEVDRDFPGSVRVNALESVLFRTDHAGRALERPAALLLADAGLIARLRRGPLEVWVRDGGTWRPSRISADTAQPFVRAFGFHRDTKTGVDHVLVGTRAGEIYSGTYDPEVPGRLRWNPVPEYRNPEFDGDAFTRVSAFCVANGAAFCSVAPRLVRRVDGPKPTWKEVYRWKADLTRNGAGLRGITAVPAPRGDHEVIVGAWEREGRILRIDPIAGFAAVDEIDSRAFLRERLGSFRAGGLTAYNRLVPGTHPTTGKPIHWVTVVGGLPSDPMAAWLLVRHRDASYEIVRVAPEEDQRTKPRVSTRTVEISPWDPREIFTGGYDGAANRRRNHDTAWICRGRLPRADRDR